MHFFLNPRSCSGRLLVIEYYPKKKYIAPSLGWWKTRTSRFGTFSSNQLYFHNNSCNKPCPKTFFEIFFWIVYLSIMDAYFPQISIRNKQFDVIAINFLIAGYFIIYKPIQRPFCCNDVILGNPVKPLLKLIEIFLGPQS